MIIREPESPDFFEPVETPLLVPDHKGNLYHPKGYKITSEYLLSNLTRPHPLWAELAGRVAAKKQDRILVPELEYTVLAGDVLAGTRLAYVGTTGKSVYSRVQGRRDCRYLPPSSGGITDSELGREYLKLCLEQGKKQGKLIRATKDHANYLGWGAPLFYEGGRHRGSFAYIDLSSAYWSIHRTSTVDMRFDPARWVATGQAEYLDTDEVTSYRGLRHTIPGSLKISGMRLYRYGKQAECDFRSNLYYPDIVGYTMYVMHCIAREVIDNFGALSVLTDAYIVPAERADELVEFLWERWGVRGVVKAAAHGALYGLNCYQIGGTRSGHAPVSWTEASSWTYTAESGRVMTMKLNDRPVDKLLHVDSSWMRKEREILLARGLGRGTM